MKPLKILLEIQEKDLKLDVLLDEEKGLNEKSAIFKLTEEVKRLSGENNAKADELKQLNSRQNKEQGQLALIEQKLKKEQGALYGGSVGNPKELKSIQQEIASLSERKDELETAFLELMERIESVEVEKAALEDSFKRKNNELENEKSTKQKNLDEIHTKQKQLEDERKVLAKEIEPDLVEEYEDLREAGQGIGIAELKEGTCQACFVELPESDIDRILSSEGKNYCPRCRRILVT